jgi:hypothetical protein
MPVNSKGREFNQAAADLIFSQLEEQRRILKIDHRGSWTDDDALLMRDAAELFAGYGLQSLYDLQPVYRDNVYSIQDVIDEYGIVTYRYVANLIAPERVESDGEGGSYIAPPAYDEIRQASPEDIAQFEQTGRVVDTELIGVINKKGGGSFPLNEINNRRGDGFTWYTVNFHGGIPVMVAWKEKTGLGALGQSIAKFLSTPGFQIFILALSFIPVAPGMGSVLSNIANSIGTSAMNAIGLNPAANPLLTKIVGDAAIRTVTSGGDVEKALTMAVVGDPLRDAVGFIGSEVSGIAYDIGELTPEASKIVGDVAATAVRAEILGGSIPQALAVNLAIDVGTEAARGIEQGFFRDTQPITTGAGTVDNYLFDDDSISDISIYNEFEGGTPLPVFDYDVTFTPEMQSLARQLGSEQSALDAWQEYEFGITADGTIIATDKYTGTSLAETKDGKTYNVTGFIDSLIPTSIDDLNKTLKSIGAVAITGVQLSNIIEGKPPTAQRPAPGTTVRNADGSTNTYNLDGTVTRRFADGRVISSTAAVGQQAQMQNLTPLLAIGGVALLLAS